MPSDWMILTVAAAYLGTLFGIAYYGDKRADAGRSIIANPYIYRKLMQRSIKLFNLRNTLRYAWSTITYFPKIAYVEHLLAFV